MGGSYRGGRCRKGPCSLSFGSGLGRKSSQVIIRPIWNLLARTHTAPVREGGLGVEMKVRPLSLSEPVVGSAGTSLAGHYPEDARMVERSKRRSRCRCARLEIRRMSNNQTAILFGLCHFIIFWVR